MGTEPTMTQARVTVLTQSMMKCVNGTYRISPPPGVKREDISAETVAARHPDGWTIQFYDESRATLRLSELICLMTAVSEFRKSMTSAPQGTRHFKLEYQFDAPMDDFLKPHLVQQFIDTMPKPK